MERLKSTSYITLSPRDLWVRGLLIAVTIFLGGGVFGAVDADSVYPVDTTPLITQAALAQEKSSDPEANLPFLFAVFIITWAGFFGYAFVSSRRQRQMEQEIRAVRAALEEKVRVESSPSTNRG